MRTMPTMTGQRLSFRDLLSPVTAEDFLDRIFDNEPLYLTGAEDRFDWLFSWEEANKLLNMQKSLAKPTTDVAVGRTVSGM